MENARSFSRQSDFHTAALYGDMKTLVREIEKDVDVFSLNDYRRSALHNATIGGQISVVQLLLVDPKLVDLINLPDVDGNTCVHLAAIHGMTSIIAIFFENGANFELPNVNGLFPVHLAARKGHLDVLRFMYESQIRLDTKCLEYQRNAVHYAAEAGAENVVQGLVAFNAVDLGDLDVSGNLPTHLAAMGTQGDQVRVLTYLAEQGIQADRNPNSLNRYPLHYAAAANSTAVVHWILEHCESPSQHANVKDNEGLSPLHMSCLYGSAASFNCLVTHGADREMLSKGNETPMDCARRAGHPVLMEKAFANKVECPECRKTRSIDKWRKTHPIPSVMQKIAADQMRVFRKKSQKDALFKPQSFDDSKPTTAVGRLTSASGSEKSKSMKTPSRGSKLSGTTTTDLVAVGKQDLSMKYYGEHIEKKMFTF